MKKLFFTLIIFLILCCIPSRSQYIQDSRIDSIVNLVSQQSIAKYLRELTGDTITIIGGIPRLIFSRYYASPANDWAAEYIYKKFQGYGLNVQYQVNGTRTKNVIATKIGTKYPNQKYIIGAHYDDIHWPINPGPLDTVPGADDNASGVCGVLEAARLLANMSFPYTIIFAAWDEEELYFVGSGAYADSAYNHGDSIRAYINMDMIAWNYNNQNSFRAGPDSNSVFFLDIFTQLKTKYIPSYNLVVRYSDDYITDQIPFVEKGYRTFNVAEYNHVQNPNYHKITDTYSNANLPYCTSLIKPTIALLTVFALNKNVFYQHSPLFSNYDTLPRVSTSIIKFPNKLPIISNAPRLYYKVNNGPYNYVNPFYNNLDTFKFLIPGKPRGSTICYYFAAQDSTENYACTYPVGGSGINPPGFIPPSTVFKYDIYNDNNQCSNTLPKTINDFQYTYDTIQVNLQNKIINKLKINLTIYHPNDGDLIIQLKGPNGVLNISQNNGSGGANYINTTFDDSASIPITQGVPPYTGSFRPQNALSYFNNQPATAPWILRVFDSKAGNSGTLVSWCILMQLKNSVGIKEEFVPLKFELHQNYPNPFNPTTNIKYQIAKSGFVTLKIYDVLGKEIQTLVSEKQGAGEYLVVFNSKGLASGIYFCKLTCNGQENFTEIKKLVLIK